MIPFAVLIPLSVLGFGSVNKIVDENVGSMLSLVCLFLNGEKSKWTSVTHQILL